MGKKDEAEQRHDCICNLVKCELKKRGFTVLDHVNYQDKQVIGEVDLIAYKNGYNRVISVEVKYNHSTKNKKKAIEQLHRSEGHCPQLLKFDNVSKMYAYHTESNNNIGFKMMKIVPKKSLFEGQFCKGYYITKDKDKQYCALNEDRCVFYKQVKQHGLCQSYDRQK